MATEPLPEMILTPGEVLKIISGQANTILTSLGKLGLICVRGRLGPVRESRYSVYYGIELRDLAGETLLLDIPRSAKPEFMAGREITACGFLQAKKGLQISLQVSRLLPVGESAMSDLSDEKTLRDVLQKRNAGKDTFPYALDGLTVSVIHGATSAVLEDFQNQIQDTSCLSLELIPVNLMEVASLREGIHLTRGAVVCLIRGGGKEGDFEVFNHPRILEAWRDTNAFKVAALGHTANTTLLDRISHKICETPTAAGKWIRDQVEQQKLMAYWRMRSEQAGRDLSDAVIKTRAEIAWQVESYQVRCNYLSKRFATQRKWLFVAVVMAAVVGILLGFFLRWLLARVG